MVTTLIVVFLSPNTALSVDNASTARARPYCHHQLFTVKMAKRAAKVIYRNTHTVTKHNLRVLGQIERCLQNPAAQRYVRWYDHHQAAEHSNRVYEANHPYTQQVVSFYDDSGGHCCGFYSYYGVADCANYTYNCYPMRTKVEFCYRGCITAVVDDHGPYISGRYWDLNTNTASAIGFTSVGVGKVSWRLVQ